jgi:hypothetical protein
VRGGFSFWDFFPCKQGEISTLMNYNNNMRDLLSTDERSLEGEKIRLLAIGSREGVIETIHTLHRLGYAEVGAWSPVLPVPNSSEVMSILMRQRFR